MSVVPQDLLEIGKSFEGDDLQKDRLTPIFIALLCSGGLAPGCFAEDLAFMPDKSAPTTFLQGGIQTMERLPPPPGYCPRINGLGTYQQAWYALGQRQYQFAADYFQIAGDQMEASAGETRFLAEARFAEAQTRRLMGQYDRATEAYKRAIAVFEHTDPRSFYLKSARDALKDLTKAAPPSKPLQGTVSKAAKKPQQTLVALPVPGIDKVDSEVPLSAKITQLDNGVNINTLHNGDFFNRSRGTLSQAAAVDISDSYTKDVILKSFLKMNCLETGAVGATHYTAPIFYKPIKSGGKPLAVGAGNDLLCPTAELKLNGKVWKVPMDLPQISPNSRNVMLVTDDKHVLAIDPRTSEAWKLSANFSKKLPEFSWWKLGKQKGRKF